MRYERKEKKRSVRVGGRFQNGFSERSTYVAAAPDVSTMTTPRFPSGTPSADVPPLRVVARSASTVGTERPCATTFASDERRFRVVVVSEGQPVSRQNEFVVYLHG